MVKKSVLIVEDDRDIREIIQRILDMEGYDTSTATCGRDALCLLMDRIATPPDLILLDLMMEGMTGWEFLDEIARNEPLRQVRTPVVVLSASGDASQTAQERGVAFLKKPVDLDVLISTVSQFCSN
jgi:CheY-like chemotaxis protein